MSTGAPLGWDLVAVVSLLCLLGSAFCSGGETGVMSVSRVRLRHLARRGDLAHVARLEGLMGRLEDAILTFLVGNNLVNVALSAVWTAALGARLGGAGEGLAAVVAALLIIVPGEIVPKIVFREYPERATLAIAPAVRALMVAFWPARVVAAAWTGLLRRLLPGGDPAGRAALGRETMAALLLAHPELAREDERFAAVLRRFLDLAHTDLRRIMTPLGEAVTIPAGATFGEAVAVAARSGYSRLPVRAADGGLAGWVLARDLLFPDAVGLAARGAAEATALPAAFLRTCPLVDEGLQPYELFEELRWQRQQMAVVVDRAGAPLGLVTLEDLVEAVVGRIEDEFDDPADAAA